MKRIVFICFFAAYSISIYAQQLSIQFDDTYHVLDPGSCGIIQIYKYTGDPFYYRGENRVMKLPVKFVAKDTGWGSWCKGCLAQYSNLEKLYETYPDRLTIFGLNYRDTEEKAKKFVVKKGTKWKMDFCRKKHPKNYE